MEKLTLEEFRALDNRTWSDEECAEFILKSLPEDLPLVQVSRAFLDACRAFDEAMEAAGVDRG
jgi:hypothetical protein